MTLIPRKARFSILWYPVDLMPINLEKKTEWQSHPADINFPLNQDMCVLDVC